MTTVQAIDPKLPKLENIDSARVVFSYDEPSDTLMVHLFGRGRAAYSDPVGDHLYLRIDIHTAEIVGFQIEHFLYCVVKEHPGFLEIAELAGVPAEEIAKIRRSIPRETRQQAAIHAVFQHLAALSYPPEEQDGINWSPPALSTPSS